MAERQKKSGTGSQAAAGLLLLLLGVPAAGIEIRTTMLDEGKYPPVPETVMILQKGDGPYTIRSAEENGFVCKALAALEASGRTEADEMPFIFELKASAAGMGANAIELDATNRVEGGVSGVSAKAWRVEWKGRAANFSENFKDDALAMTRLEDLGKVLTPGTTLDQKRVYISS